jgi:F420-non-reducing hydrogenase small subunit
MRPRGDEVGEKLQIAKYWGAGCGGCDVSLLDTNEFILDIAAVADIRFWPIAVDGKYADLEKMEDGELDVSFYNGAVRNSENEHIAKLLRQKSKVMVAYGSCAHMGGIPGLANLTTAEAIFETAYLNNPSIEPGNKTVPQTRTQVGVGELQIPEFYSRVFKLDDVVDVDYYLPGCPPAPKQVKAPRRSRSAKTARASARRRRSASSIARGRSSRTVSDASWSRASRAPAS